VIFLFRLLLLDAHANPKFELRPLYLKGFGSVGVQINRKATLSCCFLFSKQHKIVRSIRSNQATNKKIKKTLKRIAQLNNCVYLQSCSCV
jgi:hypothetical protein